MTPPLPCSVPCNAWPPGVLQLSLLLPLRIWLFCVPLLAFWSQPHFHIVLLSEAVVLFLGFFCSGSAADVSHCLSGTSTVRLWTGSGHYSVQASHGLHVVCLLTMKQSLIGSKHIFRIFVPCMCLLKLNVLPLLHLCCLVAGDASVVTGVTVMLGKVTACCELLVSTWNFSHADFLLNWVSCYLDLIKKLFLICSFVVYLACFTLLTICSVSKSSFQKVSNMPGILSF